MLHKQLLPIATAVATGCLFILIVFTESGYNPVILNTPKSAVSLMMLALIVGWPLVAGVAAADAMLVLKKGPEQLVASLPPRAQTGLVIRRVMGVAAGVGAGMAVAASVVSCIALARGGRLTLSILLVFPVPVAGAIAFAAFGWMLGATVRSWLVPPLLTLLAYGAGAVNLYPYRLLLRYTGVYPPESVTQHPAPAPYLTTLLFFALVIVASGLCALRSLREVKGKPVVEVVSGVLLAASYALMYGWSASVPAYEDYAYQRSQCIEVSGPPDSRVCGPQDYPGDLEQVASTVTKLQARLEMIDDRWTSATWIPNVPQRPEEVRYLLPLGAEVSVHQQAQNAAYGITYQCYFGDPSKGNGGLEFEELIRLEYVIVLWIDPDFPLTWEERGLLGVSLPVTIETAKAAFAQLANCG